MNIECLHNAQCSEVWNQWAAAPHFLDILLVSHWLMVCFWPWPYQSIRSKRNTGSGFIKGYQISGAPWVTQMRFSELSMVMSPDTLYRASSSIPLLFIEYSTGLWSVQRSFGHGSLLVDKVKTSLHPDGVFREYRAQRWTVCWVWLQLCWQYNGESLVSTQSVSWEW